MTPYRRQGHGHKGMNFEMKLEKGQFILITKKKLSIAPLYDITAQISQQK